MRVAIDGVGVGGYDEFFHDGHLSHSADDYAFTQLTLILIWCMVLLEHFGVSSQGRGCPAPSRELSFFLFGGVLIGGFGTRAVLQLKRRWLIACGVSDASQSISRK